MLKCLNSKAATDGNAEEEFCVSAIWNVFCTQRSFINCRSSFHLLLKFLTNVIVFFPPSQLDSVAANWILNVATRNRWNQLLFPLASVSKPSVSLIFRSVYIWCSRKNSFITPRKFDTAVQRRILNHIYSVRQKAYRHLLTQQNEEEPNYDEEMYGWVNIWSYQTKPLLLWWRFLRHKSSTYLVNNTSYSKGGRNSIHH